MRGPAQTPDLRDAAPGRRGPAPPDRADDARGDLHNIVRRDSFAERLEGLMIRYMRQQLSSAEMIAELVAMAKDVSRRPGVASDSTRHSTTPSWPSTTPWPTRAWRGP